MTVGKKTTSNKHSYVLASIPLDQITREEQVRKDWRHDDGVEKLDGLTESIRQHGILQPFLVKHNGDKSGYRLIAGHRRDVAALRAGEDTAPCILGALAVIAAWLHALSAVVGTLLGLVAMALIWVAGVAFTIVDD